MMLGRPPHEWGGHPASPLAHERGNWFLGVIRMVELDGVRCFFLAEVHLRSRNDVEPTVCVQWLQWPPDAAGLEDAIAWAKLAAGRYEIVRADAGNVAFAMADARRLFANAPH